MPARDTQSTASPDGRGPDAIRVGLLYSLTGSLATTEASIHQGAELAVAEVNAAGGIDGRPLVAITADYESDTTVAAKKVAALLRDDRVHACIGGYTSASRVAMLPALHRHGGLLVYSTYYEGLEADPRVIYAGAVPNQFLDDYMQWVFATLGRRIYMVGSDYVYPRALGAIIQRLAADAGAQIVADRYVPLGETDLSAQVAELDVLRPDVVISNLVGAGSVGSFYRGFHEAGHRAATLPIAATVTTEVEVDAIGAAYAEGHFMTATYFGSLGNAANRRYVEAMRGRFGPDAVTHVPQVGAYNAVHLFARAAAGASRLDADELRRRLVGATFAENPEGHPITVSENGHTNHPSYIGRGRADGQFDVIAEYPPRAPAPYHRSIVNPQRRPATTA